MRGSAGGIPAVDVDSISGDAPAHDDAAEQAKRLRIPGAGRTPVHCQGRMIDRGDHVGESSIEASECQGDLALLVNDCRETLLDLLAKSAGCDGETMQAATMLPTPGWPLVAVTDLAQRGCST